MEVEERVGRHLQRRLAFVHEGGAHQQHRQLHPEGHGVARLHSERPHVLHHQDDVGARLVAGVVDRHVAEPRARAVDPHAEVRVVSQVARLVRREAEVLSILARLREAIGVLEESVDARRVPVEARHRVPVPGHQAPERALLRRRMTRQQADRERDDRETHEPMCERPHGTSSNCDSGTQIVAPKASTATFSFPSPETVKRAPLNTSTSVVPGAAPTTMSSPPMARALLSLRCRPCALMTTSA